MEEGRGGVRDAGDDEDVMGGREGEGGAEGGGAANTGLMKECAGSVGERECIRLNRLS